VGGAVALGQIGLLAFWSVRLRGPSFFRALACVCLACTLVAVVAATRVSGEIRPYVTAWISMIGVIGSLAAIGPVLAARGRALPIGRDAGALIFAVGLAIPVALVGRPLVRDSQFPTARSVSDVVKAELLASNVHRPHVAIQTGSPELFFAASAVLLQLHKAHVAFTVDDVWLNFFGERWQASGREDGLLEFHVGRPPGAPPPLVCVPNGVSDLCVRLVRRPSSHITPPSAGRTVPVPIEYQNQIRSPLTKRALPASSPDAPAKSAVCPHLWFQVTPTYGANSRVNS
jgi:hypothetical protein